MNDKTILITGASSGIGFQAALEFSRLGATVIGTGRSPARCEEARRHILQDSPQASIMYLVADFASQRQIRGLAESIHTKIGKISGGKLDVLINNAGLFSDRKRLSEDGIELTFAVNHLAPFLLTHLLMPALKAGPSAKVLTVSSNSHYNTGLVLRNAVDPVPYLHFWAYKVSKLSNVLFTVEFNRLNPSPQIHAFAIDPGLVNTNLGLKGNKGLVRFAWNIWKNHGKNAEVPVRTLLHLASDEKGNRSLDVYWKNCLPKTPSRTALNPELARRLWEESCRLCGISDYFAV